VRARHSLARAPDRGLRGTVTCHSSILITGLFRSSETGNRVARMSAAGCRYFRLASGNSLLALEPRPGVWSAFAAAREALSPVLCSPIRRCADESDEEDKPQAVSVPNTPQDFARLSPLVRKRLNVMAARPSPLRPRRRLRPLRDPDQPDSRTRHFWLPCMASSGRPRRLWSGEDATADERRPWLGLMFQSGLMSCPALCRGIGVGFSRAPGSRSSSAASLPGAAVKTIMQVCAVQRQHLAVEFEFADFGMVDGLAFVPWCATVERSRRRANSGLEVRRRRSCLPARGRLGSASLRRAGWRRGGLQRPAAG
jgi:hypothetical protein